MTSASEAAVKPPETNPPLRTLGKYVIERKLGQGGMGTVYLAKHTDLKKMIALKVLPQDKAKNPTLVKRFKAEAQAAAQLEHPNIVAVFDTGEIDGYLYIAMEYVDGVDLFEQVQHGGVIPVKRSIEIMKQISSALQHAFEHHIVHRDIKPSNLMLRHDGVVKVTDLGLARSIDDTLETNITRAGTTVGTVDYMAPEQARSSKSADIRSDIYSLGCTWYHMLTGSPPFPEGGLTNKLQAHAIKPLPDPREKNENIPEGVFAILQRMTAKKPDDRYQTPADLLDDLTRSKLTKAAFSNEIFSDLSDYDIDAAEKYAEQTDEEELDEDPSEKETKSKERGRIRKGPEDDDDVQPLPIRKRIRSRDASTETPLDDTQPMKPRSKSAKSKLDDDYEELEDSPEPRSTGRKAAESDYDEDEPEASSVSKRKRTSVNEESKPASTKLGKGTVAKGIIPKQSKKFEAKPLPPKRQPIPLETNESPGLNFDVLKYVGIAASLLAVISGLGWLFIRWSNQVGVTNNPLADKGATQSVAKVEPKTTPVEPKDSGTQIVNVIDAPKPTVGERPAAEFDLAKYPLPSWATSEGTDSRDLPIFSVGPGPATASHFLNLNEALLAADQTGGIIRLLGNGPFSLSRVELRSAKKVVIQAATSQDMPLVILMSDNPEKGVGLTMSHGSLELRGLHFVRNPSVHSQTEEDAVRPGAMISVIDGQLFVRRCSFTVPGNTQQAGAALAFTTLEDSQQNTPGIDPQVLLDHVTIRGNGLTGLDINRSTADVVIRDSLFVTGTAPALNLDGQLQTGLKNSVNGKPLRLIRFIRSTLSSRRAVLELAAEKTVKPPSTAILFEDSICSGEGAGNSAVLASAIRWPSVTSTTSGWLVNLNWASKSSIYIGFERLLDLDKSSYNVSDVDTWQRIWGKKYESAQFQPIVWQESVNPEISSVQPYDFDNGKLPYTDVKTAKGTLPGCTTSDLNVPHTISSTRLTAMSQRPKLPETILKPADSSKVKKVDLNKEDLGLVINKNDWESGTLIEATGSGIRNMIPAKVVGKSLRLLFRQGDGAPLKMQPKFADAKASSENAALFTVDRGSLDLQHATLEATQTTKGIVIPWLVSAKNSTVILRGCQLTGPILSELEQHKGLIFWANDSAGTPSFLAVKDSLLISGSVGISAECGQGQVFVRNSIIAVRGYGIDLMPKRSDNRLLTVLDLEHVTFSAPKSAIRFQAAAGTGVVTSPMRFFVDYCVAVPSIEQKSGDSAEATWLECMGPVREQQQIEWWGTSNGIAREIRFLLRQTNGDSISSPAEWQTTWGDANELRLLTGTKGVGLENRVPTKWNAIKASSFALDPRTAAASWAAGGHPIGADIQSVEDAIATTRNSSDPKTSAPGGMTKPPITPPNVGNKKNVGF